MRQTLRALRAPRLRRGYGTGSLRGGGCCSRFGGHSGCRRADCFRQITFLFLILWQHGWYLWSRPRLYQPVYYVLRGLELDCWLAPKHIFRRAAFGGRARKLYVAHLKGLDGPRFRFQLHTWLRRGGAPGKNSLGHASEAAPHSHGAGIDTSSHSRPVPARRKKRRLEKFDRRVGPSDRTTLLHPHAVFTFGFLGL